MRTLANLIWILFGGLVSWAVWMLAGILLCVTVVGIPFGLQCFKMATLTLAPFGRQVIYGGGAGSFLINIIWIALVGWWFALGYLIVGVLWCCTVIGIPYGLQIIKMAQLAFMPFGAEVV